MRVGAFVAMLLTVATADVSAMDDPLCKNVGSDWEWFGDHAALAIEYEVSGPQGRQWEVGTGASIGGKPRGNKSVHEGYYQVTAYGFGAIHIRAADGGAPFPVCVTGDISRLIPICPQLDVVCPN